MIWVFSKKGVLRLNQMFSLRDWLKTIPKSSPSENLENVKEAVPDKRKVLMQNMAQLWLQQEVSILFIYKQRFFFINFNKTQIG